MDVSHSRPTVMALATVVIVFGTLFAAILYGSDARVIGIGNSANTFGADEPTPKLAKLILTLDAAPEISDEVLSGVYEAVAEKALAGDLEAATVLFEIAGVQRAKQKAEEAETQVSVAN